MLRHAVTDAEWAQIEPILPLLPGPKPKLGNRNFINAVIYHLVTACPWRDLPTEFGPWKTMFNRFDRWSQQGFWKGLFHAVQWERDLLATLVDASVVRANQV